MHARGAVGAHAPAMCAGSARSSTQSGAPAVSAVGQTSTSALVGSPPCRLIDSVPPNCIIDTALPVLHSVFILSAIAPEGRKPLARGRRLCRRGREGRGGWRPPEGGATSGARLSARPPPASSRELPRAPASSRDPRRPPAPQRPFVRRAPPALVSTGACTSVEWRAVGAHVGGGRRRSREAEHA